MYVLASSVAPLQISDDLDALKKHAEDEAKGSVYGDEFKWEQDSYIKWTTRLLLYYKSPSTGRWNKSGDFIDVVPVLGKKEN